MPQGEPADNKKHESKDNPFGVAIMDDGNMCNGRRDNVFIVCLSERRQQDAVHSAFREAHSLL